MSPPSQPRVSIFGSCVSRDPFAAVPNHSLALKSYLARQSFVGLANGGLAFEPEWYEPLNAFEKRCVFSNLAKDDSIWAFEKDTDILLIDYIDERFNLLHVGSTHVCATKHVQQPGFMARYEQTLQLVSRLVPATTALWAQGAQHFFARALQTLPAERIVLHEALWAENFRASDGKITPFSAPYAAMIGPNNAMLEEYYRITKQLVPGITCWRPAAEQLYADPDHRWSKEPFHYIEDYSKAFIATFDRTVQSLLAGQPVQ